MIDYAFNTGKFQGYVAGVLKEPGTRLVNAWIHSGRNASNKHNLMVFVNCGSAEQSKRVAQAARKSLLSLAAVLSEPELDSTAGVEHNLNSTLVKPALACKNREKLAEIAARIKG